MKLVRSGVLPGVAALAVACTPSAPSPAGPGSTGAPVVTSTRSAAAQARYTEVLALMRLDPQDLTRAQKLPPLIQPLCTDPAARQDFLVAARAAADVPNDLGKLERMYALDIIEYAAVACSGHDVAHASALLAAARAQFEGEPRLAAIEARVLAADGQLEPAARAARAAVDAGSIGALALLATIQAQQAKAGTTGYRPGQLDEALKTVSIEPDGAWRLIDLMAVLQTRGKLLTERAVWEEGAARAATATQARALYERLGAPPFIETTRRHALDVLCFDAAELGTDDGEIDACARAGVDHGNLGGAFLAGLGLDPARYDLARVQAIQAMEARIAELPAGALVVLVARGDEAELTTWARPAAAVLARLADRRTKLVVIDRSSGPRAGALVDRMVALAGVQPLLRIEAERDILVTGCVAALAAGRTAPAGCPLEAPVIAQLTAAKTFGLAVLVGRDLDAEIDDFELYALPEVLLSMRQPATEKVVDVQLKSLSDVWLLARGAAKRSGSQPPRPRAR